jgi:hypothetical protein
LIKNFLDLGNQYAHTTYSLDLVFSLLTEELSLNDHWLGWKVTLSENLKVSSLGYVNNREYIVWTSGSELLLYVFTNESPEEIEVDHRAELVVVLLLVMTHTNLTKVTWMVSIVVDLMVMFTTGVTSSTRGLSVLSYTTITHGNVSTLAAGCFETGRL